MVHDLTASEGQKRTRPLKAGMTRKVNREGEELEEERKYYEEGMEKVIKQCTCTSVECRSMPLAR